MPSQEFSHRQLFHLLHRHCKSLRHLKDIHAHATVHGLNSLYPSPILAKLIYTLTLLPTAINHRASLPTAATASAGYALSLFHAIPFPSTFPYNLLMRVHTLLSSPLSTLLLYACMRRSTVPPPPRLPHLSLRPQGMHPPPPPCPRPRRPLPSNPFFVILDSLWLKFFSPYLDLVFVSLHLFFSYFKELVGKEVMVELKNDLAIRGTLHSVNQYLNIKLENIKVVDEDKYPHMVLSVVGILQDEVDPMASVMKVEKAPLEFYVDIGGLDAQIQEIKEAVELPLTHPELYEDIGNRPPKGVILYGFEIEVVKIEYAGHARELASTVEISTYPDGDGIVNEVLNGLLSRDNQKEALFQLASFLLVQTIH
ncbi:hypothetical protein ZIOFF_063152 [Zingiber officinale]|uniref:Sm domain-containing protein n=1 Tax=Zingiber officinale TaxID=94328 RepID=A0A8J5KFZ6_ZINOF|nr:hypothetical protein ZIOFF_063152 [Zingiber officinale]